MLASIACRSHLNAFSLHERIRVRVDAFPPDKRKRDLDNIFKALLDALQWCKVFSDDSQIDELIITRQPSIEGRVVVYIDAI